MESDFLVFGGSKLSTQELLADVQCVGFLVRYNSGMLFFSSPMYEVEVDGDIELGFGFGVQIFPNISNIEEVCRNILNASGVKLHVIGETLENISDIDQRIFLKNPDLCFDNILDGHLKSWTFPIEGGVIRLAYNTLGSLAVHVEEDA